MFAFGKNWSSFSELISEDRITLAEAGLKRIFPNGELVGKPFFDIGCGSGLSMLAAHRLGASEVHGIDIDEDSVNTARRVLDTFGNGARYSVEQKSVFDLSGSDRKFPIVHSWGVLHHTGDMWTALERASNVVATDGLFALALYRKTPLCGAWKIEKRMYSAAPNAVQSLLRLPFKAAILAGVAATGRNPKSYVENYRKRGMSWSHDVHDWLGGYPYESASPEQIVSFLDGIGFRATQVDHGKPSVGLLGTHCSEFVASRHHAA